MTYIVDTHPLVWFLTQDARLSRAARAIFVDAASQLVIPTIVFAEITFLYAKQRIAVDVPAALNFARNTLNCTIYPLNENVVERLPLNLNIHDAIIVATAIVLRDVLREPATLITKDSEIVGSGLIDTLW